MSKRSIAGEIGIKLLPQEQTRLASTRPVNPEAYQAYLKGKYYTNKWNEEGFKKGLASFRQAIDLNPTYAPAYEGLAEVHMFMGTMGLQPSTESFPLARAAVLKALELDEGLAEAHADLGMIKFQFDWDWSGAEQELKHAILLNPNSFDSIVRDPGRSTQRGGKFTVHVRTMKKRFRRGPEGDCRMVPGEPPPACG